MLSPEILAKIKFFLDPSNSSDDMNDAAFKELESKEEPGILPDNIQDDESIQSIASLWPDYYDPEVIEKFVRSFPSGNLFGPSDFGMIVASDFRVLNPSIDLDTLENIVGDYIFSSTLIMSAFGLNPSGSDLFDRIRYEHHSFGTSWHSFFDDILDQERYLVAIWLTIVVRQKDWSQARAGAEWVAAFSKACNVADSKIMRAVAFRLENPEMPRALFDERLTVSTEPVHALANYILAFPGKFENVQKAYTGTLADYELPILFKAIFRLGFENREENDQQAMPIEERFVCYCQEVAFVNNLARALGETPPNHLLEGII